jgi:hypothetical protein
MTDQQPLMAGAPQLELEERWAAQCCRVSPAVAVLAGILTAKWLLFVLFLHPPRSLFDWSGKLHWKAGIVVGAVIILAPWVWLVSVKWQRSRSASAFPWAACLAILWVLLACFVLLHPKSRWYFVEWARVRTPYIAFGHNVLNWESRDLLKAAIPDVQTPKVCLVGSSQINLGTDISHLSADCSKVTFDKKCLPAFGPLQYQWLKDRFVDANTRLVVCWLSEFDFFRDDELPVNRLAWSASPVKCVQLSEMIRWPLLDLSGRIRTLYQREKWSPHYDDHWDLRGSFVDLWIAAILPIWRDRDHWRRAIFTYWWDARQQPAVSSNREVSQVALPADIAIGREFLGSYVGRKRLVEVNFLAFRRFAEDLDRAGVGLLVVEGTSHPDAMTGCDPQLRVETRHRLRAMSLEFDFTYLDEQQMPRFVAEDFLDSVHLNDAGCFRFSRFLADVVCARFSATAIPAP